jgi:predicted nucleotidyltransferase
MRPSIALQAHRDAIRRIVEANRASNARIFGSVAAGEVSEESDPDLPVEPTPEMTLFDIGAIRSELRSRLGVRVDVLTSNALPTGFRSGVLAQALPV